jgi:hypothetical protein
MQQLPQQELRVQNALVQKVFLDKMLETWLNVSLELASRSLELKPSKTRFNTLVKQLALKLALMQRKLATKHWLAQLVV